MEVSWVSISEIYYSPLGDPTNRFGKVKQCDPRVTRTPDLAFLAPCTKQLCYRANGLARWFDTCWSSTEALTSNWSLCFSFSNLWDGPRYFYGNLRCEYLACAVSSIWWYSEWILLETFTWEVEVSWVSILEIHYSPLGDPTHRFGKVKQCDPRDTRTPDLAFPVPRTNQLCYRVSPNACSQVNVSASHSKR